MAIGYILYLLSAIFIIIAEFSDIHNFKFSCISDFAFCIFMEQTGHTHRYMEADIP